MIFCSVLTICIFRLAPNNKCRYLQNHDRKRHWHALTSELRETYPQPLETVRKGELKGFMGSNAYVPCCPQSHQKSPSDPTAVTKMLKNKVHLSEFYFLFIFFKLIIYLFLAALGLRCCA